MVESGFGATHRWPRSRCRWIAPATTLMVTAVALVLAAGSSAGAAATASSRPTVTCDQSGRIVMPAGDRNGYCVLLGVVSVPPDYIPGVVPTRGKFFRPWRFWSKAGLNVRAGSPAVVVSVPKAWRNRAAITWEAGPAPSVRYAWHVAQLRLARGPATQAGSSCGRRLPVSRSCSASGSKARPFASVSAFVAVTTEPAQWSVGDQQQRRGHAKGDGQGFVLLDRSSARWFAALETKWDGVGCRQRPDYG